MSYLLRAFELTIAGNLMVAAIGQLPPNAVDLAPNGHTGLPQVVHAGDTLHAFWPSLDSIYYNRSADGGLSWLPAERQLAAALVAPMPAVAAEGAAVYCVYTASNLPTLSRSLDEGVTWLPPVPISTSPGGDLQLVCRASSLLVVWASTLGIYANRSADGGNSWQATDTRLDVGIPDLTSQSLQVVQDGQAIHVFWTESSPLPYPVLTVAYQRSTDGGATWLPAAAILGYGRLQDAAVSGATVLVATDHVLLRSTDGGSTWATVSGQVFQSLAMSGSFVVADNGPWGGAVAYSRDAGASWLYAFSVAYGYHGPGRISLAGGTAAIALLSVNYSPCCTVNDAIWVSGDLGATWSIGAPSSPSANGGFGAWPLDQGHLFTSGTWAWLFAGYGSYGTGKPGTGAIAPRLAGSGVPMLGSNVVAELASTRGGAVAAIAFGFAGPANQPFGSGTIYVTPPAFAAWAIASGTAGTPGVGTAALSIAIPNDVGIRGLRVNLQGFVLDPNAADGFASSAGLEMWVR